MGIIVSDSLRQLSVLLFFHSSAFSGTHRFEKSMISLKSLVRNNVEESFPYTDTFAVFLGSVGIDIPAQGVSTSVSESVCSEQGSHFSNDNNR
jgi:hypothetical protein